MNLENEIQEKANRLMKDGETVGQVINRVLGEAIEEREDLSNSSEAARAREALRQGKSISDADDVDFRRTKMTDH